MPANLATSLNLASGYHRNAAQPEARDPDVAMEADPYTGYHLRRDLHHRRERDRGPGCAPISKTTEYCKISIGGTSLASPLMAGVIAVMNPKRVATGEPLVGFANPMLYSIGSQNNGLLVQ